MAQVRTSSKAEHSLAGFVAGEGSLHDRLSAAAGELTYRAISDMTGVHAETVRRYMQGQSPSIEFVAKLCGALGISGEWMLTGKGPMREADTRSHALREANPVELLSAMAGRIEVLSERVERLEATVESIASRGSGPAGLEPMEPGTRKRARRISTAGRARPEQG